MLAQTAEQHGEARPKLRLPHPDLSGLGYDCEIRRIPHINLDFGKSGLPYEPLGGGEFKAGPIPVFRSSSPVCIESIRIFSCFHPCASASIFSTFTVQIVSDSSQVIMLFDSITSCAESTQTGAA